MRFVQFIHIVQCFMDISSSKVSKNLHNLYGKIVEKIHSAEWPVQAAAALRKPDAQKAIAKKAGSCSRCWETAGFYYNQGYKFNRPRI